MEDELRKVFSGKKKSKDQASFDDQLGTSCRLFFTHRVEFRPASKPDSYLESLKSRYKPLNRLSMETDSKMEASEDPLTSVCLSSGQRETQPPDDVPKPKKVLFQVDRLEMKWKQARSIGAGLYNMGNTCFLNSVLQCLLYTAPLYNYLMSDDHKQECRLQGFCPMCELQRHCYRAFNTANGVMRPVPIVQNLKVIAKHFRQGRQEDAHELLRYLVDGLQKSCLQRCPPKLDPHSKATTVIHQIFGGYHRSQVKCLSCQKTSDTFDPLLDISLDIKNCPTLIKALQRSIKADLLDGENKYACPFCKKMTRAQKKFTVHRLPRVLTIQLKRFDYHSAFGGKINKPVAYVEYLNMRRYMSQPQGPTEWYRLYGVLVHYGFSCHSGHYLCYVRNSNGIWYCMNDSEVSQVSFGTVLQQEAYLLFYIKDEEYRPPSEPANPAAEKTSSPKIEPDPNFLGTPVTPSPGLEKMGTPLVKHPQKPTGVVTPSPHATPTLGRQFSIPLRKASTAGFIKHKAASSTPTQPKAPPPKAVTAPPVLHPAFKSPGFTPRAITAPPKPKKLLHKTPVDAKQPATATKTEANVRKAGPITTEPQSPPGGKKVGGTLTEVGGPRNSESKEVRTLLDIAEIGVGDDLPPAVDPATGAASVRGNSPARQQTFIGPVLPPCLQSPPPPPPPSVQPFVLKSPTSSTCKSPRVALVPPLPHPVSKPVARVLPSPQVVAAAAASTKPNLETANAKKEEEIASENPLKEGDDVKGKEERKKDDSKHQKSAGDDRRPEPGTDEVFNPAEREQPAASEPHMNSRSHWTVTTSPQSGGGGEKHSRPAVSEGYDSTAHGWTVIPLDPVTSDDDLSEKVCHGSGSSKKKKKKPQKPKSYTSDSSSESESESDSEDEQKRKKRNRKKKPRYSSSEDDFTERIMNKNKKKAKPVDAGEPKHRHDRPKRRRHTDTDSGSFERRKGRAPSEERLDRKEDRKYDLSDLSEAEGSSRRRRHGTERAKQRRHRSSSSSGTDDEGARPGSGKKDEHVFRKLSSKHFRSRHYRSPHRQHHQYHSADSSSEEEQKRVKHHSDEPRRERGITMNKPRFWRERDHFRNRPYNYHHHHHYHHPRDHRFDRSRHASDEHKWKERSYQSHWGYRHKLSPDSWRRKRMSSHRDRDRSRTPERNPEKRHRTWSVDVLQTPKTPVVEVHWDGGGHAHQKWDGSRKSETMEQFISQMGTSVKSWGGGQNTMDSSVTEGEGRKRARSQWDEDLDRGKVKKVKQHRSEEYNKSSHGNLFQDYQSRRNMQGQKWPHREQHHGGGGGRPKHGSYHHHPHRNYQ